jgi:deazaflavin-dependent oxidoreductase (nitroreductase family)
MAGETFLYLTTTGHRSGKSHVIEIWYVEHEGCYYIVSEKREAAHWVRNIRANPVIRFRLGSAMNDGGADADGEAFTPDDAAILAAVKAKMDAKYGWSNGLAVGISRV